MKYESFSVGPFYLYLHEFKTGGIKPGTHTHTHTYTVPALNDYPELLYTVSMISD